MKRFVILLFISLFALLPIMAQQHEGERPRFSPELFKARMESYIREKAGLNQEECDKLFPLYHEMHQKQKEIYEQIHKLKKSQYNQQTSNATKTITEIMELKVKLTKIEQTYYTKMCKTVSGEKVLKVMHAEDTFHREMLKLSNNERRGKKN